MAEVPYLDFYRRYDISPVAQDISNLATHFQRRDSLYRFLGIPPAFMQGRRVVEFGPGSGHNALYTASLRPSRFLLVDGNPRGVAETRAMLERHAPGQCRFEVLERTFEEFDTDERFDLVLAEGFIPHTEDPSGLLRRLARYAVPGGIVVTTTVSASSLLAENLRRLIRVCLIRPSAPPDEQIAVLLPALGPHLSTLRGMSRPHEHWLLDVVIRPVRQARLLSVPEAVSALADEFDAYGMSPHLITDFRWYKDVVGEDRGLNDQAVGCYEQHAAAMIDYRHVPGEHSRELGRRVEDICRRIWEAMHVIEERDELARPAEIVPLVRELAETLRGLQPETIRSLDEIAGYFEGRLELADLDSFASFWGRGQQYLSLIRRPQWPR